MNSTRKGDGNYRRTRSQKAWWTQDAPKPTYGPGDTNGFYAFLSAEVKAGRMTACEKQSRVWAGK